MPWMARSVVCCTAVVALSSCVPVVDHYMDVEAPGARHLKTTCGGTVGTPNVAYFPYHGIFLSVQLYPTILGLHVPDGVVAKLDADTLRIVAESKSGSVDMLVRMRMGQHRELGSNFPPEFGRLPDPVQSSTDALSSLTGASVGGSIRWYLFIGVDPQHPEKFTGPPPGLIRGTIELPPISVNGTHYPSQVFPFHKQSHPEILPVNC